MIIDEIKSKKGELKKMATDSLLFAVSEGGLKDIINTVDLMPEDETSLEILNEYIERFEKEKQAVLDSYQAVLNPQD